MLNFDTNVYQQNTKGVSDAVGLIPFSIMALKRELSVLPAFLPDTKVVFVELKIDSIFTNTSWTGSTSLSSSFLSTVSALISGLSADALFCLLLSPVS